MLSTFDDVGIITKAKKILCHYCIKKNQLKVEMLLQGSSMLENLLHQVRHKKHPNKFILIWDTGALFGLSSLLSDSINYAKYDIPVMDIIKVKRFIEIVTMLHKFIKLKGKQVLLPCMY